MAYFRDGEDIIVTAGFLGVEHDPNWVRNLEANPDATIVVEGRALRVRARRTTGEERERLWARWLDLQPASERFARIAGREIPVIRLTLVEHSIAS